MKTNLPFHGHLMLGKDSDNTTDNNDDGDDDSGAGRLGCTMVATITPLHEMTRWLLLVMFTCSCFYLYS